MTSTPTISVVLSVYNGEAFVADAIESIRRQTFPDFEMIVVDDGSNDGTAAILDLFQVADPRIHVLTLPRVGLGRATNTGLAAAKGKYIARLDADDLAKPKRLEIQLAYLQEHPEVGLLGTSYNILRKGHLEESPRPVLLEDAQLRRGLVRSNQFLHSSLMIPRRVFDAVGVYNEKLPIMLDFDLIIRITRKFQVANLAEPLAIKRVHDQAYFQSRSHTWPKFASKVRLRWRAWRAFSRRVTDLRFVLIKPVIWYLTVHVKRPVRWTYRRCLSWSPRTARSLRTALVGAKSRRWPRSTPPRPR